MQQYLSITTIVEICDADKDRWMRSVFDEKIFDISSHLIARDVKERFVFA